MRVTGIIGDNTDPRPFPLNVELVLVGFNPRDLFACFALAGLAAADPAASLKERCKHAYEYADGMIEQRKQSTTTQSDRET